MKETESDGVRSPLLPISLLIYFPPVNFLDVSIHWVFFFFVVYHKGDPNFPLALR